MTRFLANSFALVLVLVASCGCAGARRATPRAATEAATEAATPRDASAGALAEALERALADPELPADLRVDVECRERDELRTFTAFAGGAGIWNRRVQVSLDAESLRTLLRAFQRAGFAHMPARFGGPGATHREGADAALRVSCLVALRLAGLRKEVVQVEPGPRSAELQGLAAELLRVGESVARSGRGAADLSDALRLLVAGELAPETFALVLHRKRAGHEPSADPSADGFLLRIDGRHVETQPFRRNEGYGEARTLELSDAEVTALAARLADEDVARLPVNLYAEHYTDLSIEVLAWRLSLQARAFDGLEPTTLGERQQAFERVYDELERLQERALTEGQPAN